MTAYSQNFQGYSLISETDKLPIFRPAGSDLTWKQITGRARRFFLVIFFCHHSKQPLKVCMSLQRWGTPLSFGTFVCEMSRPMLTHFLYHFRSMLFHPAKHQHPLPSYCTVHSPSIQNKTHINRVSSLFTYSCSGRWRLWHGLHIIIPQQALTRTLESAVKEFSKSLVWKRSVL